MTNYKINVVSIENTWKCSDFKFMVRVKEDHYSMEKFLYILRTLRKWFDAAEYFWNDNNHNMVFLCSNK